MLVSILVNSYGINGMGYDALDLFRRMPTKSVDEYSYLVILNACSHSGLINEARSIYDTIKTKSNKISTAMVKESNLKFTIVNLSF